MQQLIKNLLINRQLFKWGFYVFSIFVLYGTLASVKSFEPHFFTFFKFKGVDKLIHFGIFFILSILFFLAYLPKFSKIILLLGSYGVIIEILQEIMPNNRTFDIYDILFNILGISIGYYVISSIYRTLILK